MVNFYGGSDRGTFFCITSLLISCQLPQFLAEGGVDNTNNRINSVTVPGQSGSLPGALRIKSWRCESDIRF